jgi:membrane-bound hydrogenase subunit beta
MPEETEIQEQLSAQFPFLKDKITVARARRIFAEAPAESFEAVFDYAVKQMGFTILCTITGLDQGATLGAIYHLARTSGVTLNLSVSVPKDAPILKTVTAYFPQADCYERELIDLLGMQVQGLPPGHRYPLPDDWPANQYPLRKDWKKECLQPKEAKDA